jgi:hypothetical protein
MFSLGEAWGVPGKAEASSRGEAGGDIDKTEASG